MSAARALEHKPQKTFKHLDDFRRKGLGHDRRTEGRVHREWTAPVDQVAQKARDEARRLAIEDGLTRTYGKNSRTFASSARGLYGLVT
jgi:hypothetical protein